MRVRTTSSGFVSSAIAALAATAPADEQVDFNFQIRPLLSDRCFRCHGPDADAREAEMRLDTADNYGRDHHPRCFSIWMAGGGVKAGHVHDFQATLLRLLGVDHERLTYLSQGRRFRLTDVHGRVVNELLA